MPLIQPYLDDDFVRFVGRIPSSAIFAGAWERGLLRASMPDIVPDSIRFRRDKAEPSEGFVDLYKAEGGYEAVRDLADVRELGRLGMVDREGFRRAFERFAVDPATDPDGWTRLWGAITGEAYLRWFHDFNTACTERGDVTAARESAP